MQVRAWSGRRADIARKASKADAANRGPGWEQGDKVSGPRARCFPPRFSVSQSPCLGNPGKQVFLYRWVLVAYRDAVTVWELSAGAAGSVGGSPRPRAPRQVARGAGWKASTVLTQCRFSCEAPA